MVTLNTGDAAHPEAARLLLSSVYVSGGGMFAAQLRELLQPLLGGSKGGGGGDSGGCGGAAAAEEARALPHEHVGLLVRSTPVNGSSSSNSRGGGGGGSGGFGGGGSGALSYVSFVHMQARDAVARRYLAEPAALDAAHATCAVYFELPEHGGS